MAANVTVPCNFDLENLYDQFHGNIDIVFSDDTKMKASSLILSWNSATFSKFFNILRLSSIEIKDFTKEAVIMFLECMYSGNVKLEKHTFREMYKLSFVFKSDWLLKRCREFFSNFCEKISNEFEDLRFVFDEAVYCKTALKSTDLITIVDKTFSKDKNIESIFVEDYLNKNFASITSDTLDFILQICKEDFLPVLKCLKQHLLAGENDDTTRSLLSNSRIVECFASNVEFYEDIYELLSLKTDSMTIDDFRMLNNLNLCVIKATRCLRQTDNKQLVLLQNIPNLFHDLKMFEGFSAEEIIERLSSMYKFSVFMALELFFIMKCSGSDRNKVLQYMALDNKSLCRVPNTFLNSLYYGQNYPIRIPLTVISDDDTAVIVSTETTFKQLATTSELYKFHFQHPSAPPCEKHTECGFLLKVTPCLKEEVGNFSIQLVTEESEYPAGIHCHSEMISAAHMHLVVEEEDCNIPGGWFSMYISWKGKPEYRENRVFYGLVLDDDVKVRLVVYIDIRDRE